MRLTDLGLTQELSEFIREQISPDFTVGRVTQEHRERYVVSDGEKEYDAEITGNIRFAAASREDFPAVGDWVTMTLYGTNQAVINKILPRKSLLARQAVGKTGEIQIISANIDCAFIVQAINNNFNINRLERYLTICYSAGIEPVLVLSKTDLVTEKEIMEAVSALEKRDRKVKHILLSNITREGVDHILEFIKQGRTYCVIGSSGVGKSTLINKLLKREVLRTGEISSSTNKGKHVTEHRELFILENGGIIIDTPGMKELGNFEIDAGLAETFSEINEMALQCKYSNCTHEHEKGCAVLKAVKDEVISHERYRNYIKMKKEAAFYEMSYLEKRQKDKNFGKMVKSVMKNKQDKS